MSFKYIREIPQPVEILGSMPLPASLAEMKNGRDEEIRAVFTRKADKLILIIGPARPMMRQCAITSRGWQGSRPR
jgi:3-deoxy-7-phosphoheptulonate synthase